MNKVNTIIVASSVLLSASFLQGCNEKADTNPADIAAVSVGTSEAQQGTTKESTSTKATQMKPLAIQVLYLDRSMLEPGAVVEVSLLDVSKADSKSDILAQQSMKAQGGPPYALVLDYDLNEIKDNHRYSLRATIKLNENLLYTSTEHLDPFANEAKQPFEIIVKQVEQTAVAAEFTNTYWKLMKIGKQDVPSFEGAREMFVQFMTQENQVRGFSGCNNFMGNYEVKGSQVTLTPLAGTRKMCVNGMEQEQAYLNAMANVVSFTIEGETLTLNNSDGEAVVSFESRYMN
ncbi:MULTISPECIES: META domain-containing protein [unclassified Motilimonas]|uniref:META domain-containing protein n=1 Tax=Motilimonas TaxID=1914248 RepID=UPI001E2D8CAD|nr:MULTISPECIES: META domain-containing protein [unclassified Motilimonas]MCE0556350.1 META domain-containing protein [Motilimonas sp. E26]MDO6525880.1 META domain-containing protein [Motilimonas sp. 1_MG-2023]